ncbi:acyl-CoA thioester hydrolase [Herbihabitans rhizosphaerae]|uniref:Acyl-CoA thioester hydrolase n=1 Tax=Herbihabitans rhizosphaerae TaxID=1872711 RepID=A0A4Q7L167_9PSEU|nr:thioesterase family protein [Herbihabitans rhizosphaerae]RZS43239.1 acyl-CoA thioester hydrolase [Herbihabitans rhizosphaerae]
MTTTVEFGTLQRVQVHFDDLDAMGIVHNARYGVLVERALSTYWLSQGWTFNPATSIFPNDQMLAVREVTISYHTPISTMDDLEVHLWVEHLGRTSIRYGARVLSADHSVLHAEAARTQVKIDPHTRRSAPLSPEFRAAAERLMPPR